MAEAFEIRVRGRVQGVGFRPAVWRYAREFGLDGEVLNDGEGVLVRAGGSRACIEAFIEALRKGPPPLARIDTIHVRNSDAAPAPGFRIGESARNGAHTQIVPDAATCPDCAAEIGDAAARRYRYPFANCCHCGPRLSIVEGIPYDRGSTTMRAFAMCPDCAREYHDPADRRFHAEPTACPACGPKIRLIDFEGRDLGGRDPIAAAARRIAKGQIVAVKGIGGYQLACDATNAEAVARLRRLKRRDGKPFAMMARDLDVVARYAAIAPAERAALLSAANPIVLLRACGTALPQVLAPGLDTLGFLLPASPLHILLLAGFETPVVMTSGNLSGMPQIMDDDEALSALGAVADCVLTHDRAIANRLDDSVLRLMAGGLRALRRARGYAPEPLPLPPGFEAAPDLLAMGGELKATFCLVKDGAAVLSQHLGDLEQEAAFDAYRRSLKLYRTLFDHRPVAIAVDGHPDYLSTKLGHELAVLAGQEMVTVQHHHAHIAACMAENLYPLTAAPVLGIALDGLGYGRDGTLWGGEFLLCDYRGFERLACFKPVAMPGGTRAIREPWRNLVAHLDSAFGPGDLLPPTNAALAEALAAKPGATMKAMIARGINAPLASSCGRLFDAVAAALGICFDAQSHEGEAAARLEALAASAWHPAIRPYTVAIVNKEEGVPLLDVAPMWSALLADLAEGGAPAVVAARFHAGLAHALARMAVALARSGAGAAAQFDTVALSGGCFQNRILFEAAADALAAAGFVVMSHSRVPANDGGLALGQAAIAAGRLIGHASTPSSRRSPCASAFPAGS